MSDYERTERDEWEDEVTHFGWYGSIPAYEQACTRASTTKGT